MNNNTINQISIINHYIIISNIILWRLNPLKSLHNRRKLAMNLYVKFI